jgi:hypothetical protein
MDADACGERITAGLELIASAVRELTAAARAAEPRKCEALAGGLRAGIVELGRVTQALHGELLMLVAEGDRLGVAPGGMGPWLASVLDVTAGRGRILAQDARALATVPELEAEACSGRIGPDTLRAVARTVKAVKGTDLDPVSEVNETLRAARDKGARAGLDRARALEEHVDPGSVEQRYARQRERSFARFGPAGDGEMCRFEVLLDPLRGATLRAAIEVQTGAFIRARQFDGTELVPQDVRTTEQMNAEAVTRLAQVFLDAPAEQRGAPFTVPTLAVTVHDPAADPGTAQVPPGCAVTVYGALIPASTLPAQDEPGCTVLKVEGDTGLVDGKPVDRDPEARLASPEQRTFLTWRDRYCRYPGCDRPTTYGLNAHHRTPYGKGGTTTVRNMVLYCSQHHTVIHHGHKHG